MAAQSGTPGDESLLPPVRALLRAYAQLERVAARHLDSLGVTPAQFDVLATLGDERGMTCKDLGARSLISRGTLIPVLDRMEARGLIRRCKGTADSRQTIVSLTPEGQALYERTFPPHVAYLRGYLDHLAPEEQAQLVALLGKFEAILLAVH